MTTPTRAGLGLSRAAAAAAAGHAHAQLVPASSANPPTDAPPHGAASRPKLPLGGPMLRGPPVVGMGVARTGIPSLGAQQPHRRPPP